ncbi:MAG: hypothetical protein JKX84_02930, partial [Flavobacteriales bacterium]|nr:hypothetical protein [Flavobacteriales bacterium]
MSLVKLEWSRRPVSDKILRAQYITRQMALNVATYATPNPTLADVDIARANLNNAAVDALSGGVVLTLAKNIAEKVLDELIAQLVAYVQNVSGGSEALILQAGMDVRKLPSPLPPPAQIENLNAYPTRSQGEIQLNWDSLG